MIPPIVLPWYAFVLLAFGYGFIGGAAALNPRKIARGMLLFGVVLVLAALVLSTFGYIPPACFGKVAL